MRLVFTPVALLLCCSAVLLDFFSGFVAPAGAQSGSPKSWLTWGGGVNYRPGDYLTVRQPDELSELSSYAVPELSLPSALRVLTRRSLWHAQTAVFELMYPGWQDAALLHNETGFTVPTPFGDGMDVLLSDAESWLLSRYSVVVVASELREES